MNYNIVKKNYDRGLWDVNAVVLALAKNVITEAQFMEITGVEPPSLESEGKEAAIETADIQDLIERIGELELRIAELAQKIPNS